jgi:hypothetical protein
MRTPSPTDFQAGIFLAWSRNRETTMNFIILELNCSVHESLVSKGGDSTACYRVKQSDAFRMGGDKISRAFETFHHRRGFLSGARDQNRQKGSIPSLIDIL